MRLSVSAVFSLQRMGGMDDGVLPFHGAPPFHTLVGPGQFARVIRDRASEENKAQPGGELVVVVVDSAAV